MSRASQQSISEAESALDPEDMRRIMKCSKRTIYRLAKKGAFPTFRVGGSPTGPIRCRPEVFANYMSCYKDNDSAAVSQ